MCTVVELLCQGGHDDVVVLQVQICDGKVVCNTAIETFKRGMAGEHGPSCQVILQARLDRENGMLLK